MNRQQKRIRQRKRNRKNIYIIQDKIKNKNGMYGLAWLMVRSRRQKQNKNNNKKKNEFIKIGTVRYALIHIYI